LEDIAIAALEHGRGQALLNGFQDFVIGRPDIFQIDRVAVAVFSQGIAGDIDFHISGQRIGNNQGRGGQIVRTGLRADTAFEVPVAGQNGGCDQIAFINCI